MYAIILSGGSGSRLWPLSRELYPKQLIPLNGKFSPLQNTCKRIKGLIKEEKTILVTNIKHSADVKFQLRQIQYNGVVLAEPMAKNTAPAIASALSYIRTVSDCDESVIILPSDHLIQDTDSFLKSVEASADAINDGYIVTFGVNPTYPESGYGYIKTGNKTENFYRVVKFVEKPDIKSAKEYLKDKNYFWNSGIFAGKISTLEKEFSEHAKKIFQKTQSINFNESTNIPYSVYEDLPEISFDYAVMEKTDIAVMCELACDWEDLGSWQSVYKIKEKDKNGNVVEGNVIANDLKNSLIFSAKKLVAVSGLEDVILVETEDAIMACKKDKSQDVKKLYDNLKEKNLEAKSIHKTVFRPWGYYTCLADGKGYLTKLISVSPKQKLSIQSHNHRSEHWVVLEGKALVVLDGKKHYLESGQSIDIPLKAIHSLQNPYDDELRIIEVQKGDYIAEDDIIRYEDAYGRV